MKYWGSLKLDVGPYLPEDTDGNRLQADLLTYLKESQYLGRETAKKIGAIAYENGFAKNLPGNPFLYQYSGSIICFPMCKHSISGDHKFPLPMLSGKSSMMP